MAAVRFLVLLLALALAIGAIPLVRFLVRYYNPDAIEARRERTRQIKRIQEREDLDDLKQRERLLLDHDKDNDQ